MKRATPVAAISHVLRVTSVKLCCNAVAASKSSTASSVRFSALVFPARRLRRSAISESTGRMRPAKRMTRSRCERFKIFSREHDNRFFALFGDPLGPFRPRAPEQFAEACLGGLQLPPRAWPGARCIRMFLSFRHFGLFQASPFWLV